MAFLTATIFKIAEVGRTVDRLVAFESISDVLLQARAASVAPEKVSLLPLLA